MTHVDTCMTLGGAIWHNFVTKSDLMQVKNLLMFFLFVNKQLKL